jgi:CBS domain-containing protein
MKIQLVKDVLTGEVLTISPLATVKDAMKLMKEKGVKSVVVDKTHPDDAYGILTYTDILRTIAAEDGDIGILSVYDIYRKPAITVSQFLGVKYAAEMMIAHNIKRLPVVDNNELAGIISMSDIIDLALADHI